MSLDYVSQPWVVVDRTGDDLPDVIGPFSSEHEAEAYAMGRFADADDLFMDYNVTQVLSEEEGRDSHRISIPMPAEDAENDSADTALDRIHAILTGHEWDSATIEDVAQVVASTGRKIEPPAEDGVA